MTTISRNEFKESLRNKSVALDDVAGGNRQVKDKLQRADLDGDGKISGGREVDAAWKTLDDFDKNGSRNSMRATRGEDRGVRAARSMMDAARPASARAPSRGLGDTRETDTRGQPARDGETAQGAAAQVRADGTAGRFQGGVGPVNVERGRDGKAKAVQFKADMDVDTDGGTSALARSDRYYQSETSMKFAGGKSLDASKLPFIVLPPSVAKATGAKLGDLVEVEQNGKKMYGIYGDNGPSKKIGEASLFMAQAFDPKAGPNRAAAGTFTYTVLPGSGAEAGIRNGGPAKTAAEIQAAGARAFAEFRARS